MGDYMTPIEERIQGYLGKKVNYRNDLFKFQQNAGEVNFMAFQPEEDGVINYGQMAIYDVNNNELVKIIKGEYKPYEYLDDDSKIIINNFFNETFNENDYQNLNEQQLIQTNFYIENQLKLDNIHLLQEYKDYYDQGIVLLTYPSWDGSFDDSDEVASIDHVFRRDFTPIHAREDGSSFSGNTDREVLIANVESVDQEDGKLILNMVGGSKVPEDLIISN